MQRYKLERDTSPTQGHTTTLARDPPNCTKRKQRRMWVTNCSIAHVESYWDIVMYNLRYDAIFYATNKVIHLLMSRLSICLSTYHTHPSTYVPRVKGAKILVRGVMEVWLETHCKLVKLLYILVYKYFIFPKLAYVWIKLVCYTRTLALWERTLCDNSDVHHVATTDNAMIHTQ